MTLHSIVVIKLHELHHTVCGVSVFEYIMYNLSLNWKLYLSLFMVGMKTGWNQPSFIRVVFYKNHGDQNVPKSSKSVTWVKSVFRKNQKGLNIRNF